MSQITGAGFASGAIGAGVNEAIIGEIKKIKDPGTAQIVSAIVGAAATKAVGGNAGSGASAAASGTKNNLYEEVPAIREQLRPLLEPKTYQTLKDFEYQVLFAEENGKKIAVAIDNRGRVWDLDVLEDTTTGLEKFKFHDETLNAQPATFVIFKYNDYALREYPLDKTDEKITFRKGAYDGKIADIFSFDVGFIKGCAKSAVAMTDGFIEFVNHPIQSLEVINSFMQLLRTDPEFRKAVGAQATAFFERKYKQLNEGDKHQQGEIAGEVFTEIIALPIPGSKLVKSAKGIEFTSKISNLFGKTAHASSASRIVARDIGNIGENTAKIHMRDGKLLPNIRYQAGEFDYFYETDHLGRLKEFKTDKLQLTERTERLKHNPDTPGKLSTDHSGHLAADRFGGSPELDNLVSQSAKVNLSEYRKLENRWAQAIQEGKNVKVKVKVLYRMDDPRPSGFDVRYEIDGRKFHQNISQ